MKWALIKGITRRSLEGQISSFDLNLRLRPDANSESSGEAAHLLVAYVINACFVVFKCAFISKV